MKIPKNQKLWETFRGTDGAVQYAVCSDAMRQKYTLYRAVGEKAEKVAQADSPKQLYPLMDWNGAERGGKPGKRGAKTSRKTE